MIPFRRDHLFVAGGPIHIIALAVAALIVSGLFTARHSAQAQVSDKEKIWIVLSLQTTEGRSSEMAFNNPALPDITLDKFIAALPQAIANLMDFVKREPRLANAQLINARCVKSMSDPIKPK